MCLGRPVQRQVAASEAFARCASSASGTPAECAICAIRMLRANEGSRPARVFDRSVQPTGVGAGSDWARAVSVVAMRRWGFVLQSVKGQARPAGRRTLLGRVRVRSTNSLPVANLTHV